MRKAISIRVFGKVQNVGYRFYAIKTANQLDIKGFVKNESAGTVYIEAEGEPVYLETFTDWCREGPQWARVDRLEVQDIPLAGYTDFRVR